MLKYKDVLLSHKNVYDNMCTIPIELEKQIYSYLPRKDIYIFLKTIPKYTRNERHNIPSVDKKLFQSLNQIQYIDYHSIEYINKNHSYLKKFQRKKDKKIKKQFKKSRVISSKFISEFIENIPSFDFDDEKNDILIEKMIEDNEIIHKHNKNFYDMDSCYTYLEYAIYYIVIKTKNSYVFIEKETDYIYHNYYDYITCCYEVNENTKNKLKRNLKFKKMLKEIYSHCLDDSLKKLIIKNFTF